MRSACRRSRRGCSATSASSSAARPARAPEPQVGVDAGLQRAEPQLLQARDRGGGEGLEGEVGERLATPQAERVAQPRRRLCRVAAAERRRSVGRQPLEALEVDVVGPDAQPVAGRQRLHGRGGAEGLAQLGDLAVDLRDRGDRRRVAVEVAGEPVDRHDAVGVEQQHGQQRPLPRAAEADGAVGAADRERAENREAQCQTPDRSARAGRRCPTGSRPVAASRSMGAIDRWRPGCPCVDGSCWVWRRWWPRYPPRPPWRAADGRRCAAARR